MRLQAQPFALIKSNVKKIELRLYDEKRRTIQIGDEIEFVHIDDETQRLYCKVLALHLFPSFQALYERLPLLECGYTPKDIAMASHKDMEQYYTEAEQRKYGVVGIELTVLSK